MRDFLDEPPSPCSDDCTLDGETGVCRGCLRTIDEIARWGALAPEEKWDVLRRIADARAESE